MVSEPRNFQTNQDNELVQRAVERALKAERTNIFSASSNPDIERIRNELDRDGQGDGVFMTSRPGGASFRDLQNKEKEKREQTQDAIRSVLHQYLIRLNQDIAELEDLIDQYQDQLDDIAASIAENNETILHAQEAIDVMATYMEQGKGRVDFLREHLPHDPEAMLEVLSDPIRDENGNMVYLDSETGNLYRLNLDPENGGYERVIYTDPHEIAAFYNQAYDSDDPAVFANETPMGRDFMNMSWQEFLFVQSNLPQSEATLENADGSLKHLVSVKFIEGEGSYGDPDAVQRSIEVCDNVIGICTEENIQFEKEQKQVAEQKTKAEEKLEQLEQKRDDLEDRLGLDEDDESYDALAESDTESDSAFDTLAMTPDPHLDTIAAHKNTIASRIADGGGALDMDSLKEMAQQYGIPASHVQALTNALNNFMDIKITKDPEEAFAYGGPVESSADQIYGASRLHESAPDMGGAFKMASAPKPEASEPELKLAQKPEPEQRIQPQIPGLGAA